MAGASEWLARGSGACSGSNGYSITELTREQIQEIVTSNLPTVSPNIGVAVGIASPVFGTEILCLGSLVDQFGSSMQFTTDTSFEVASVTKTVTASIYELFVQSGRIHPNDTVGRFIGPEVSSKIRSIPLVDLADFTSGLPEDNVESNNTFPSSAMGDYTTEEMLRFLADPPFPISAPGKNYVYSNLGFSLLAVSLQVAGRANGYGPLAMNEILGPLGMEKTQAYNNAIKGLLPQGFDTQGNPAGPGSSTQPAYNGAGGLVSTPNDMMTWLQFNMGIIQNSRLSPILSAVQAPITAGISGLQPGMALGLGWFTSAIQNKQGNKLTIVQKNGDLPGFCSQIALLVSEGCSMSAAGAFALVNYRDTTPSPATNIAYDLLFALTGQNPDYTAS